MSNYHLTTVNRADFTKTTLPPKQRHSAKSVMKVFADYANENDMAWPHVSTIALEAGCGKDTVSGATEACVKANLLRKRRTATGNKYVLNMKLLKQIEVPRKNRRNPDFPEFDDTDLHESPPEPDDTKAPDPLSDNPKRPSDLPLSDNPTSLIGLSDEPHRVTQQASSDNPTQIPYRSLTDPPVTPSGGASSAKPGLSDGPGDAGSDADASKPPAKPKQTQPKPPNRRGTRLSEDFKVTPEMVAWCRQECPNVDGRRQTMQFMNYWLSRTDKGAVKGDWVRTWKNWMLKEQSQFEERNKAREARAAQNQKQTQDEKVLGLLELGRSAGQNGGLFGIDNHTQFQIAGGGDIQ